MYIFAKFVADHIFLQNRDKLNIKNSPVWAVCLAHLTQAKNKSHSWAFVPERERPF
jgi:hypothetical protein